MIVNLVITMGCRVTKETHLWACLRAFPERFNGGGKTHHDSVYLPFYGLGSGLNQKERMS